MPELSLREKLKAATRSTPKKEQKKAHEDIRTAHYTKIINDPNSTPSQKGRAETALDRVGEPRKPKRKTNVAELVSERKLPALVNAKIVTPYPDDYVPKPRQIPKMSDSTKRSIEEFRSNKAEALSRGKKVYMPLSYFLIKNKNINKPGRHTQQELGLLAGMRRLSVDQVEAFNEEMKEYNKIRRKIPNKYEKFNDLTKELNALGKSIMDGDGNQPSRIPKPKKK